MGKHIPPPYPSGPFTPQAYIGGWDGTAFSECLWGNGKSGVIVNGLDVWWNDKGLNGIRLRYANNTMSPVWGAQDDNQDTLLMKPGERITALTLWGNGKGTQTGRISIYTTDANNHLDVGKDTKGQTAYTQPIGAGIMVGADGYSSKIINMLGFIFLDSEIKSILVEDVEYNPSLTGSQTGINSAQLSESTYFNKGTVSHNYDFKGTTERTNSTTFTQSSATMYGLSVNVDVSAEIFGIGGSVNTGFQWQNTSTQENSVTSSQTQSLAWGVSGPMAPGTGVKCEAWCKTGSGSTSYTSTVLLTLKSGYSITYNETGTLQCIEFTQAFTTISEFDIPPGHENDESAPAS